MLRVSQRFFRNIQRKLNQVTFSTFSKYPLIENLFIDCIIPYHNSNVLIFVIKWILKKKLTEKVIFLNSDLKMFGILTHIKHYKTYNLLYI